MVGAVRRAGRARRAACAAALALAVPAAWAQSPAPRQHTVHIDGMAFVPAALHVKRGDRIVFVNQDLVPHTATAKDGAFDSGRIAAGASWALTASRSGRVALVCAYHPTMTATLVVD